MNVSTCNTVIGVSLRLQKFINICEKYFIEIFVPWALPRSVGEIKWKPNQKVFRREGFPRLLYSANSPVNYIAFSIAKPNYDGKTEKYKGEQGKGTEERYK
jgi:hypothetical protein